MLRTWDLSVEDTYLQQTTQVGDAEVFTHADISPDGQQVAYSWLDDQGRGWVRFVDAVTGDATSPVRFPVWDELSSVDRRRLASRRGPVRRVLVRRRSGTCATPGTVTVLDSATGQPLRKPTRHRRRRRRHLGRWRTSTRVAACSSGDSDARDQHRRRRDPSTPGRAVRLFAFAHAARPRSGTGARRWSASGPADGASTHWRVLDVSTGEVLSEGDVDLFAHASVASPDGSTVAVAGDTGEIVTIDVSTGAEQRRSAGLGAPVYWLDYSDDGELLVSGAEDGGVSLWDATTLDLLGTVYPPHRGEPVPAGAQFIGDTHDVAIASYDGRVYRWETDLDRAIDFACQMAGRNLTEDEWAEFLPAQPYREVCPGL